MRVLRRRYNKEALRLRIFYLLNQPAGAESHTALVQDIPGVAFGTIPNRADGTLLKLIPKSELAWAMRCRGGRELAGSLHCAADWSPLTCPECCHGRTPTACPACLHSAGIKEQAFKQTAMLAEKGSGAVGSGVKAVPLGKHEAAGAWPHAVQPH